MTEQVEVQPGNPSAVDADFESNSSVANPAEEKPAAKVTPKEEPEAEGENTTDEAPVKKPTNGYKKKAERLAAENADLIERLKKQGSGQEATPIQAKPAQVVDGKPKADQFSTHEEWIDALTDWKVDQARKKETAENNQKEVQKKHEEKVKSFETQKEALREKIPDLDDVLGQFDDVPVKRDIHSFMLESDKGAEIAHYLATHPEEFEKVNDPKTTPASVARTLAKIELSLSEPEEVVEEEKPAPVRKSTKAPEPIEPVSAARTKSGFDPNTADPDEYIAHRWKERQRK